MKNSVFNTNIYLVESKGIITSHDNLYGVINSYLKYTDIPVFDFDNSNCDILNEKGKINYNFISRDCFNYYKLFFSFYKKRVIINYSVYNKKYGFIDVKRNNYIDEETLEYIFFKKNESIHIIRNYNKEYSVNKNNNHLKYSLCIHVGSFNINEEWISLMGLPSDYVDHINTNIKQIKYNKLIYK